MAAATANWASSDGKPGAPSCTTRVAPVSSEQAAMFHMIQAVEAYQENRSPGPMSMCSPACLSCSTATPPCPCTIPLGSPVVPEE